MAIATAQMREYLAIAYGSYAAYGSLHTADPGSTGTSEVSGGSPAYARKALTWSAGAVDGNVTATATFDVPTGVTVSYGGFWSAVTTGTYLDKLTVTSQTFNSQGQLVVTFTYTQS